MPRNICVDLNIVLDVVLEREHYHGSKAFFDAAERNGASLYISAHEITTFSYILESVRPRRADINIQLAWALDYFMVVPVNERLLRQALEQYSTDYEDAVVEQAALSAHCDYIVTRNVRDFKNSAVPARTPEAFLKHL